MITPDARIAELEPCPFCGGNNVKTFGPYGWYRQWGISHSCRSFYSGAQELAQGFHTEAAAIAAWNTRSANPLLAEHAAMKARVGALETVEAAAKEIIARMSSTYKARNGREVGIEADDGEKCWIVHSDDIEALSRALIGTPANEGEGCNVGG